MSRSPALGSMGISVLRTLADGPARRTKVVSSVSGLVAPAQAEAMIDNMLKRGLLMHELGRLHLTLAGRRALPKGSPPEPMRPYVPPRVIRRAGSEVAAKLPSVAAGRRYYPETR